MVMRDLILYMMLWLKTHRKKAEDEQWLPSIEQTHRWTFRVDLCRGSESREG
jgi:hypothetical protein